MFQMNNSRGFGLMDVFLAAAVLAAVSIGFLKFFGAQKESEQASQTFNSQAALVSTIVNRISKRDVLIANAPEGVIDCLKGKGCKTVESDNIPYPVPKPANLPATDIITGSGPDQAALYSGSGRPCNRRGSPLAECPIGVWSTLHIKCLQGGRCDRPQYVFAKVSVAVRRKEDGKVVTLSSRAFSDAEVPMRQMIMADCRGQEGEIEPDSSDSIAQRSVNLSEWDRSYFYGYNQAFSDDYQNIFDRDYSSYCRKARIIPSECDSSDGGFALRVMPDGRLGCASRTTVTSLNPGPATGISSCGLPKPTPTPPNNACSNPAKVRSGSTSVRLTSNVGDRCPFGSGDNLDEKSAKVRARLERQFPIVFPAGVQMCDINVSSTGSNNTKYDDQLFLMLNQYVIMGSLPLIDRFQVDSNGGRIYDWRKIRNADSDRSSTGGHCAEGITNCQLPQSEQTGNFSFSIPASTASSLFEKINISNVYFNLVLTGDDNRDSDCQLYRDVNLEINYTYATP